MTDTPDNVIAFAKRGEPVPIDGDGEGEATEGTLVSTFSTYEDGSIDMWVSPLIKPEAFDVLANTIRSILFVECESP